MPRIESEKIGIALDMHGCPNRCRHCWLGCERGRRMPEGDLRWAADRFRAYFQARQDDLPVRDLAVSSWFREPDFSDDYRRLYDLESELSDCGPTRYELLSIWRLARDEGYASWAKEVGTEACQVTFFGLEETNDWFYRRRGAFGDAIVATERLLEAGIRPRWQLFLTVKILPEIGGLLRLVEEMKLRERTESTGGAFDIFMHPPGPDGEARGIEHLRPTIGEVGGIPEEILAPSRKHYGRDVLWRTEAEILSEILKGEDAFPYAHPEPDMVWFTVTGNWDVFSNMGTLEPWWKLGNLKEDAVQTIVDRFQGNATPGLETIFTVPGRTLAEKYGDPKGTKVYSDKDDLLSLFVGMHCEEAAAIARGGNAKPKGSHRI